MGWTLDTPKLQHCRPHAGTMKAGVSDDVRRFKPGLKDGKPAGGRGPH
jgi:hypothetical protein